MTKLQAGVMFSVSKNIAQELGGLYIKHRKQAHDAEYNHLQVC